MIPFGNALLHLIAIFLLIGFAWWFFDQNDTLATITGTACIGVIIYLIPSTLVAIMEDSGDFQDNWRKRKGRLR